MRVNNAARRAVFVVALAVAGSLVAGAPSIASTLAPRSAAQPATPQPGPLATTPPQPANLIPLDNGFGPTPAQSQAMAQAATTARTSKKPVMVSGLTSETQQVIAQPQGGFTLAANTQPVRTKQHNTWVPVDTTLHANPDGTWSPAATAYGTVSLSGGGSHPLATTTSGATTYAMSWPTALPTPVVSGSTATYPNVLPGVDLQVSATVAGGFSDVLVVHTAEAAHNPALANLTLTTTVTGGHATAGPHGGITVTSTPGGNTLTAATPLMWDSNTTLTAPTGTIAPRIPAGITVRPDTSDAVHPGLAAHLGVVRTKVSASSVDLVPDPQVLTGPATIYPVYIDPSFGWHPTNGGAPAFDDVRQGPPCTNTSFFGSNGFTGDGRSVGVGYNNWDSCFGVMRSFYQWQLPTVIWGAHIGNVTGQPGASVNITKTFSAACVTSADYLHWSGGIGPGTSWNSQPGLGSLIGTTSLGHTGACPGFGSVVAGSFDVTSQIAASAAGHATQFTVALTGNETRGFGNLEYSRFSDNPVLQISFNHIPNTPGANQMAAVSGADNAGCATTAPYPYIGKTIATNTPVLDATVSDPDSVDHLQASYQYWIDGTSNVTTASSADNLASGSTAQYSLPNSFTTNLANGQVVDWHVRVTDGEDWSGWSPVCHFTAEPNAPSAPSITSVDGAFPNNGTVGNTAGTPGRFTIAGTGGAVTKLVEGLDQAPPATNPPAADIAPLNGGGVITPAARWQLNDGSGGTAADSIGSHPATLTGGATWSTDPTRGEVLSFDGTTGYATANGPVLDTTGNFTIAAWVNLANTTTYSTAVSQGGVNAASFYLQYSKAANAWAFVSPSTDSGNAAGYPIAHATSPPTLNTWTHLAGTFDATSDTMTLYVNGTKAGTTTNPTPWNGTAPLTIGAAKIAGGGVGNYFPGQVSDVQAYQAALSATDIARIYAGNATGPAGRWRFLEGSGTTSADSSGNNHAVNLAGGATWSGAGNGGLALDGATGYAGTAAPVLTTTGSYTVSAWVNLTNTNTFSTAVGQGGVNAASFYLQYSKAANAWAFVSPSSDSNNPTGYPIAHATSPPTLNTWTHLAGTFDATSNTMTLYVNGIAAGSTINTTPWTATGPLTIGAAKLVGGTTNNYFPGQITDVQTYPTALNAAEIAQMYASATLNVTPPSPGPHFLSAYATDAAGDTSGHQTYPFMASADANRTCASLAACFNNTAISPDNNPGLGAVDGINSFSATDLTNAGWNSGSQVTVNGATFTLPNYGAGQADNVLAANQTIAYNQKLSATGGSALEFLATSTNANAASPGAIQGDNTAPYVPAGIAVAGTYCFDATNPAAYCPAHGTIHYSDGTAQPFYLTVPDWILGPEPLAAIQLPHENTPAGQAPRVAMMFPFSVPLTAGKTIVSVTLPDVGNGASPTSGALHIFGMATRDTTTDTGMTTTGAGGNTTTISTLPTGQTWTGAWGAPTEGLFNYGYTFSNQTFREAIKPSLTGNTIRVKFDDALGINPIQIAHATIALSTGGSAPSPATTAAPVDLVFGANNNKAVTVPQGGMVYSNPLPFTVPAGQYVLVSFQMTNTAQWLVTHTDTSGVAYQYTPGPGTGDKTADTAGTVFLGNGPGGPSTNVVTGLDVQTTGTATQAVLGDGFIDEANTGTRPTATHDLADTLTGAEPTTPSGYGTLAEGIESNQIMTDYPEHNGSGPAALSRIDRDILDQPNITTVVLNEGLEDTLNGRTASDLDANGYTQLINNLQSANINVIAIGQTPCDGYTGDGATPNDPCTAAVDQQRTLDNTWLSEPLNNHGPGTSPAYFYLDPDAAIGVPDSSNGETQLHPAADSGDHVNLTNAGYGALTSAYLGAQDTWPLNDGTGATQASDAGNNAVNPYLFNNPLAGNNPATLTGNNPTATWTTDPTRGTVMTLDGTNNEATTAGPVLTTTGSFTVSAWADVASTSHNADIISQDATNTSGFALQYDATDNQWAFTMPTSDTTTPTVIRALSGTAPATGAWTHLVGTYNAATHTVALYVNGTLTGTATNTTPINATGVLALGRGQANATPTDYFPGNLSTIAAWNYALTPTQITALYQQIG